jgi:hypothetical protein
MMPFDRQNEQRQRDDYPPPPKAPRELDPARMTADELQLMEACNKFVMRMAPTVSVAAHGEAVVGLYRVMYFTLTAKEIARDGRKVR